MEAFRRRGIPDLGMETMINSISKSTLNQYESAFKKWWIHCKTNNKNPWESKIELVIAFLSTQKQEGKSFSTINQYKSALSLILNFNSEQEKLLKRFLKGIYNQVPPKPKYVTTWDPQPVLTFLENLYPLEKLSLQLLSYKLITLLALISGHRIQTFSKINLENISESSDKIEIKIPEKIKTSNYNQPQPILILPFFKTRPAICLAKTINFYINKTKNLRNKESGRLILTFKKPYKPATTQTLSRWIKEVLKRSGINTDVYSSYSTRHASTSAALRGGVNIEIIRKRAGWTKNSNTFAKFYNKPLEKDQKSYAEGVLLGSNFDLNS